MKKQKNKKTPHKILDVSFNLYKKVKFFIRLALVTVIAGIIGIVIIIKNTDPNKYKDDITISIEKMTGNTVKINGDLKWKIFSFEPAIKIEELSIKNEPWGKAENIFTAQNITATVSLKHLLKRQIALNTLIIDEPKIYLEVSPKGIRNWHITEEKKNKIEKNKKEKLNTGNTEEFQLDMKSIHITNAEIFYNNRQLKKSDSLKISNILITSKDYIAPIFFSIATEYKNTPITGNFKTDSLKSIIDDPNKIHLTGIIDINNLKSNFSGIINYEKNAPSVSMTLSISAPDLQESLKHLVDLPKFAPIDGSIELIATQTFLSLKKIDLKYLSANLTGNAEINLQKNNKPNIKADLLIPFFDIPNLFYPQWEKAYFNRLATGEKKPSSPSKHIENPKAFRDIPLPVSELNWVDGNIKLNISKLKAMPEMEIEDIKLNVILNNGQGIISPFSCKYMGGTVLLNGIASNKNNTFNGEITVKVEDVNVGKIIDSTGYKKFFTGGNTNIDAVLRGYGPNLATFMKNLNGYIKAYTTDKMIGYKVENILMANDLISSIFKFIGNDIIGTIAQKDKKKEQSEIQCIVLNLNIENGKTISNRGIAMQTETANIIIDGLANLGDEYVDVSIITVVKEGFRVSNTLTEMIKIQGPIAEPNIIINKDGVINNVAKTAFSTALVGALTGGVTLITTGLGLITKSWLNNIQSDKHPCLTAFEGKASKYPEDFSNQVIIKEKLQNDIEEEKERLDSITNKKIENEKQKIKSL
ncbi:MAG: AsmA family protein [bacterium]|nr:AsmA family protein [bacterium]